MCTTQRNLSCSVSRPQNISPHIQPLSHTLCFWLSATGYIGRHTATKGINLFLEAARLLAQRKPAHPFRIIIFGRPDSATSGVLKSMCSGLDVEWRSEYKNANIVRDVFDRIDSIVVRASSFLSPHVPAMELGF